MLMGIFILLLVPFLDISWIGANHAEEPFIFIGQIASIYYFSYFLIIIPFVSILENTLADIVTNSNTLPPKVGNFSIHPSSKNNLGGGMELSYFTTYTGAIIYQSSD
ncbi:cytochrome b [Smittium mucronatum]|uniref:Cytochrome b n=1 Tax=Smittium mucronatum TaxID=133383 RepID=A0A1R0GKZ9_9FUNG|nr:cytochrome b [Smittium mucronatum]